MSKNNTLIALNNLRCTAFHGVDECIKANGYKGLWSNTKHSIFSLKSIQHLLTLYTITIMVFTRRKDERKYIKRQC